jgi:hypothetical protein
MTLRRFSEADDHFGASLTNTLGKESPLFAISHVCDAVIQDENSDGKNSLEMATVGRLFEQCEGLARCAGTLCGEFPYDGQSLNLTINLHY